ncbi:hypothetical protein H8356DRAFT_1080700 [Neocallimastix lanati (nom. inval.)]|nr:hypothetical protein H8356DRAFT_1080700 [Neocallimastix sp. JGI-2020a]
MIICSMLRLMRREDNRASSFSPLNISDSPLNSMLSCRKDLSPSKTNMKDIPYTLLLLFIRNFFYDVKLASTIIQKNLLNNCISAYLMIKELNESFSETDPSRLYEIEMKIKKLEININYEEQVNSDSESDSDLIIRLLYQYNN